MLIDFLNSLIAQVFSIERIEIAMIAMVLSALLGFLLGPISGNANPLLWVLLDKVGGGFSRKIYNVERSLSSLRFRGFVLLGFYICLTLIVSIFVGSINDHIPFSGFTEPFFLSFVISAGAPWSALIRLHHAIQAESHKGKSKAGRGSYFDMAVSTRTNLNTTDNHGIIRVGIGFIATHFDKAVVAPLFWYMIAGLPAAYLYAGIAAARWGVSKDGFSKGVGHIPLEFEKLWGMIPQILSAIFLSTAAAFTPKAAMSRAIMGMGASQGTAPYAQGGLPLTVLAWGLGISLGGPVEDRDGSVLKRAWVGGEKNTARVETQHLRSAIYLGIIAYILLFATLSGVLMIQEISRLNYDFL